MTVMRHKSVDERRKRRQRYKDAVKPIKELFGCTSMQAAGLVQQTLSDNKRLNSKVEELEKEIKNYKEKFSALEALVESKDNEIEGWRGRYDELVNR